jgi:hypothetical protein
MNKPDFEASIMRRIDDKNLQEKRRERITNYHGLYHMSLRYNCQINSLPSIRKITALIYIREVFASVSTMLT